MQRIIMRLTSLAALLVLAGCAPAFSRQTMDRVDRNITFARLQGNPDQYRGAWVVLAGVIIRTTNTAEGSMIEVLQRPLDRRYRPRETDATEGRFIISSPEFLDAAVYHEGRQLSVVGEVTGQKMESLGEVRYRYPVIQMKEVHFWEPRTSPRFSFGLGIGIYR